MPRYRYTPARTARRIVTLRRRKFQWTKIAATVLSPAALVHTRAQGAVTVSPKLLPLALVHTRGLGTTTVKPTLVPLGLVHTRTLGTIKVNVTLKPLAIVHTRALGTITVTVAGGGGASGVKQYSYGDFRKAMFDRALVKGPGEIYIGG